MPRSRHWVAKSLGIDVGTRSAGSSSRSRNRVAKKLLEEDEEIRELAKRYVAAKGVSRLPILEPELARRVSDLSR
jgi:hypothetical protein